MMEVSMLEGKKPSSRVCLFVLMLVAATLSACGCGGGGGGGGGGGADTQAPAVSWTDPVGSAVRNFDEVPMTLTGSASDNVSVSRVEVSTDDGAHWADATADASGWSSWHWTAQPTAPGEVEFLARAWDSAGNVSPATAVRVSFTNDPVTTMDYPQDGAELNAAQAASLRVTGTAAVGYGDTIAAVEVSIDGGAWSSAVDDSGDSSWSSWHFDAALSDGNHTIYARARRSDGAYGEVVQVEVTVDATSPSITSASAQDASGGGAGVQAGDKVFLAFSESTDKPSITTANVDTILALSGGHSWGGVECAWSEDGRSLTVTIVSTASSTVATGDVITPSGISDEAGNPVTGTVVIGGSFGEAGDSVPPVATVTCPADGSYRDSTPEAPGISFYVRGTAEDFGGGTVASVEVYVVEPSGGLAMWRSATYDAASGTWYYGIGISTADGGDGEWFIYARATDDSGNVQQVDTTDPSQGVRVIVDRLDPDGPVVNTPAAALTTGSAVFEYVGRCEDGGTPSGWSRIEVSLDGGATWSGTADIDDVDVGPPSVAHWSYLFTPPHEGVWTLRFRGVDKAGNVGDVTAAPAVTFDWTAPAEPDITTPPASPTYVSAGFTVAGTAEADATVEVSVVNTTLATGAVFSTVAEADGTWSVQVLDPSEGRHEIRARAVDEVGNASEWTTPPIEVYVDRTAPVLTWSFPADGYVTSSTSITLRGTSSDAITHVTSVELTGWGTSVLYADPVSPWTFDLSDVPEGVATFTVTARDASGNTTAETRSVEFDYTPPEVSFDTTDIVTNASPVLLRGDWAEPPASVPDHYDSLVLEISRDGGVTWVEVTKASDFTWSTSLVLSDGEYVLRLRGTDMAGNIGNSATSATTAHVIVDTVRPSGSISFPPSGYVTATPGPLTVQGTASDALSGVDRVQVSTDGGATFVDATYDEASGTWSAVVDGLQAGSNTITLYVWDRAGNGLGENPAKNIFVDLSDPSVAWTTPPLADTSVQGPDPYFSGTALDPSPSSGLASVMISLDSTTSFVPVSSHASDYSTWSHVFNDAEDGWHYVYVYAVDNAGRTSPISSRHLIFDSRPPVTTITSPVSEGGTWYTSSTVVEVGGDERDPSVGSGYPEVTVLCPGAAVGSVVYDDYDLPANRAWITTLSFSADGTYVVSAYGEDLVGNVEATPYTSITVVVDRTQPDSGIDYPLFECVDTGSVEFAGTSTDTGDAGISRIWVMVDDGITVTRHDAQPDGGSWESWICTVSLADGYYEAWSVCEDRAGNRYDGSEMSDVIDFFVDTQAPSADIVSPQDGALYTTTVVDITVDVDDPSPSSIQDWPGDDGEIYFYLDGSELTDEFIDSVGVGVFTLDLEENGSIADGDHVISVFVCDAAGNTSPTTSVTIHLDRTRPEPRNAMMTDSSGGGLGLQVGDSVVIEFSEAAYGSVDSSNIATALALTTGTGDADPSWGTPPSVQTSWSDDHLSLTVTFTSTQGVDITSGNIITPSPDVFADAAGNAVSGSVTVTGSFGLDLMPPVVTIEWPDDDEWYAFPPGGSISITGSATDTSGVTDVRIKVGDGAWTGASEHAADWSTWSVSWTVPASDGEYEVWAYGIDARGNAGDTDPTTSRIRLDRTSPTLVVTSPADGSWTTTDRLLIAGTASDGGSGVSTVEVSLDGGVTWNLAGGTSSWSYVFASPHDGEHYTVAVRAVDAVGNSTSATVETTVDFSGPRVLFQRPSEPCVNPCEVFRFAYDTSADETGFTTSDMSLVKVSDGTTVPLDYVWIEGEDDGEPFKLLSVWPRDAMLEMDEDYTFTSRVSDEAGNATTMRIDFHTTRIGTMSVVEKYAADNYDNVWHFDTDSEVETLSVTETTAVSIGFSVYVRFDGPISGTHGQADIAEVMGDDVSCQMGGGLVTFGGGSCSLARSETSSMAVLSFESGTLAPGHLYRVELCDLSADENSAVERRRVPEVFFYIRVEGAPQGVTDEVAPRITIVRPGDGGSFEARVGIWAIFSEPMDPLTITTSSVRLTDVTSESVVDAGVIYDTDGPAMVRVMPNVLLESGHTYSLEFGASLSDLSGNSLGAAEITTFEVQGGAWTSSDARPPCIISMYPENGTTGVCYENYAETVIRVKGNPFVLFDEPLDPASLSSIRLYEHLGGKRIPLRGIQYWMEEDGDSSKPVLLTYNTLQDCGGSGLFFTSVVEADFSGVRDLAGNSAGASAVVTFQGSTRGTCFVPPFAGEPEDLVWEACLDWNGNYEGDGEFDKCERSADGAVLLRGALPVYATPFGVYDGGASLQGPDAVTFDTSSMTAADTDSIRSYVLRNRLTSVTEGDGFLSLAVRNVCDSSVATLNVTVPVSIIGGTGSLVSPADGSEVQTVTPTFTWQVPQD